jgi:hypothetical protein
MDKEENHVETKSKPYVPPHLKNISNSKPKVPLDIKNISFSKEYSTYIAKKIPLFIKRLEISEGVTITPLAKSNKTFFKIEGLKSLNRDTAEELINNELMKQFFIQNVDKNEKRQQTGHYDEVTLVMENVVHLFQKLESKTEFYLVKKIEEIEKSLKFSLFAKKSKEIDSKEKQSQTKNCFIEVKNLENLNIASLNLNFMKNLSTGDEIYTNLGKIIFYNKNHDDFSQYNIDLKTIKDIGLSHNSILRTKLQSTWKIQKLDELRNYLKKNKYIEEIKTKKSVHVFHQAQKFHLELENEKISTFLYDEKLNPTEFLFHDNGCDIILNLIKRISCPETFKFGDNFEENIKKILNIETVNSQVELTDGFYLNDLFDEDLKHTYLMDLNFEKKEIFSNEDFAVEIKTNNWRKLKIEQETDLSNGIYIYSKKLRKFKGNSEEIQQLFDFTLKIKQEFDKFE